MQKFIFSILFFLFSLLGFSQTNFYFSPSQYNTWQVSDDAQCGVGNIYCIVVKSYYRNSYGNYEYYIYFASNSYFYNCSFVRTYVPDININYLDGRSGKYQQPLNFFPFWVTIGETSLVYTLYHPSPNLSFLIRVGKLEPTIY